MIHPGRRDRNRTGEIAPQKHASTTEGESSGQRYRSDDDAKENNVDQQISDVVLLVKYVFSFQVTLASYFTAPRSVCASLWDSVPAAMAMIGPVRLSKNGRRFRCPQPQAAVEQRDDRIDAAQMFGGQCWRRILDQHQRHLPRPASRQSEHHLGTRRNRQSAGRVTLMLIEYPTPALAAEHLRRIDAAHHAAQPQPGVAGIENVGPFFDKRTGPIIAIAAVRCPRATRRRFSCGELRGQRTWKREHVF